MTARALTAAEQEAFRLARLTATERCPYFAHALFAVSPLAAPGLGTFGVDSQWRLYMEPDLLVGSQAWSVQVAGAVLLHEVGHLVRDHAGRASDLGQRIHRLAWNLATDAELNDDLLTAGVPLPEGCVTPAALGCSDGDIAEHYYATIVPPDDDGSRLPDDGGEGCGSGSGSGSLPGEFAAGESLPDGTAVPLGETEGDMVRRRVAHAVEDHEQAHGRGSIPAGMARWAGRVLSPSRVPWQRVLRAAVRSAVADRAGRVTQTYSRPSRRPVAGMIRPALRAPLVTVSIVVDTSGSMSADDLTAAMAEVQGVLAASGVARDRVTLLSCDAAATTARRVRRIEDVALSGGGGTDMRIGIAAAEAARPVADVVVVATDGDTPWPAEPTRARLVCVVISNRPAAGTPPWAVTVHVPPAQAERGRTA